MPAKKPKPVKPKPIATIPAWKCPTCGATHPITVPTCCNPPSTIGPQPWRPVPTWWEQPPIICGAMSRTTLGDLPNAR